MTPSEAEKNRRRDVPAKVDRWMKSHLSHINKILLRTTKIDNLRVDEQLGLDILSLAEHGRLSSKYRENLLIKYGFEKKSQKQGTWKVKDPKLPVAGELMRAIAMACHKDSTIRDSSCLEAYWRQATTLNQRDCCLVLF